MDSPLIDPPLLHHRLDGTGPHVVLLHPVGLDLGCFDRLVKDLDSRYRILRPDLPGHGRSPMAEPAKGLRDYVDDVHRLLAALAFAPAAVIGFSFGGMLAQLLALEYPDDVNALVIAACPSTLTDQGRAIMTERGALAEREGTGAGLDATMARWFTESFRQGGGDASFRTRISTTDVSGWVQAWRAMAAIDTAPRLESIAVPTLCLAGEADVSSPPQVVEAIARRISGARFVVIPGAPHMSFVEQPIAVAAAIGGFLDSVL
jgi:3-oxoadipate enol-lactonase